jgi:hypothetical protein
MPDSTSSRVFSPSVLAYDIDDGPLQTKIKALVSDLVEQPPATKRYVLNIEKAGWTYSQGEGIDQQAIAPNLIVN